jgi:hypothetical protein
MPGVPGQGNNIPVLVVLCLCSLFLGERHARDDTNFLANWGWGWAIVSCMLLIVLTMSIDVFRDFN